MNLETTFDDIQREALNRSTQNEEDYVVDGLLYCGKCHAAKQTRVMLMGREITPMCLCECEAKKRDEEEAARKEQERFRHIMEMRSAGFSDKQMRDWTFENDDQANAELTTMAKNYVDNFRQMKSENHGLLLYGTVGTGKTYIAACIANALIDKGYPCLVTNFSRLINEIQKDFEHRQDAIDRLSDYDLLVIDDFAAERSSEYMNEIIFTIIDERYRSKLPLIITTNLTGEELNAPSDVKKKRIYSRLYEMCIPVEVKGEERRRASLNSNYSDTLKTLKAKRGE